MTHRKGSHPPTARGDVERSGARPSRRGRRGSDKRRSAHRGGSAAKRDPRLPLLTVLALSAAVIVLSGAAVGGCTDVGLYQWQRDPFQANKLTVSGTVCTDDPRQRNFPVKVLFVVDTSLAINDNANDPTGYRGKAVQQVITDLGKNPNYHFGVIAFAGKARSLIDTGFTQESTKLTAAAGVLQGGGGIGGAGGCFGPRCRDMRAAMSLASSVITGDILAADPGENSRTSYVIIFFSGGPPVPAVGRCACRDLKTEADSDNWPSCAWAECDGCKVTCPANTRCNDTLCEPICNPACDPRDEYCDVNFTCQQGSPGGIISLPPISNIPQTVPDTFNYWVLPVTHNLTLSQTRAAQAGQTPGPCVATCVYYPNGGGHSDSCEERVMVQAVRELRQFASTNGTASLQLHTAYLPDKADYTANPTSVFRPLCDAASDKARTVQLLTQMAFAGGGGFREYGAASAIAFDQVELFRTRDPLVIKELVVTNANVLASSGGILADSDRDGISDDDEKKLGTCPSNPDTDGDGIGDGIEVKLAMDPLKRDDPIECVDIKKTTETLDDLCNPGQKIVDRVVYLTKDDKRDGDGDGFNPCEERLLGTIDTLIDSDADGIPDNVEFAAGTNYLAVDPLQDIDFDGTVNREEVRAHTDPRSNDAQAALDLAYRYEEVDEGIKTVLSFTQPPTITGVQIKNVSSKSSPGLGTLKFDPGGQNCTPGQQCPSKITCPDSGKCPPTLAWKDFGDTGPGGDFGPPVDISKPNREGYRLESCLKDQTGSCTPESKERFITVTVEGPQSYPPKPSFDRITISSARRNCLRFSVKNITLLETLADPDLKTPGNNNVFVYFAQAPQTQKDAYGIFRVASVRLNYILGPPERRTPRVAEITFTDDDFVLFQ